MITNFHYLIAVYSVPMDMLFEYWNINFFTYGKEQEILQTSLVFHWETFLLTGKSARD